MNKVIHPHMVWANPFTKAFDDTISPSFPPRGCSVGEGSLPLGRHRHHSSSVCERTIPTIHKRSDYCGQAMWRFTHRLIGFWWWALAQLLLMGVSLSKRQITPVEGSFLSPSQPPRSACVAGNLSLLTRCVRYITTHWYCIVWVLVNASNFVCLLHRLFNCRCVCLASCLHNTDAGWLGGV